MSSKLRWLILIQLLLVEKALCHTPPPLLVARTTSSPERVHGEAAGGDPSAPEWSTEETEHLIKAAGWMISNLTEKLPVHLQDDLLQRGKVSCEDLLAASSLDDPSTSVFPQEVLGLSLVPVLVVSGCPQEALTLILKLYHVLGVDDTGELLMELEDLMEKKMSPAASQTSKTGRSQKEAGEERMEALMFNIQQLAGAGEEQPLERCDGWTRVNRTVLVGTGIGPGSGDLLQAVRTCEVLGTLCGGVTLLEGRYQAVLKKGSRVLPSPSDCWIRRCHLEAEEGGAAWTRRARRSLASSCVHQHEQRVFRVLEWIPGVSTLYSLGTAVYYASVNCSQTARERALLSAVDLGTDALIVATGGTVGVAGYAVGAGVKTGVKAGVKYLLNSMKQEGDVLVNQFSSDDGVFTVQ